MTFQPYQEAEEEELRRGNKPLKAIKYATSLGVGALGGNSLVNRILPFLNNHIPENIAKKGIAKVSPHLGKFVESATNLGHDFYEIRDFIRGKAAEEKEEFKKPKENRNVIQQYSPELHQYILDEIQKGRSPLEAGAVASMQDTFKEAIKKITKDHKAPFSSIIETVYGNSGKEKAIKNAIARQSRQPSELSRESLINQFDESQQANPQQNQGKAALLQTMQEITETLRRIRGNG